MDPIVEAIHVLRDEYAKRFNYDLQAMHEDLTQRYADSPEKHVTLPPKRVKPADSTASLASDG